MFSIRQTDVAVKYITDSLSKAILYALPFVQKKQYIATTVTIHPRHHALVLSKVYDTDGFDLQRTNTIY